MDGTFSMLVVNGPHKGAYLRHEGFELYLHKSDNTLKFKDSATFRSRKDKFRVGFFAAESVNYPGYFIRHQNYRIKLHKATTQNLYKEDASWTVKPVTVQPVDPVLPPVTPPVVNPPVVNPPVVTPPVVVPPPVTGKLIELWKSNTRDIHLISGQKVTIRVKHNASTGFNWKMPNVKLQCVKALKPKYHLGSSTSMIVGSSGFMDIVLEALPVKKATTSKPQFKLEKGQSRNRVPAGWRLATAAEARANKHIIKRWLSRWAMAHLADGWKIDGSGYGNNVLYRPKEKLNERILVKMTPTGKCTESVVLTHSQSWTGGAPGTTETFKIYVKPNPITVRPPIV
jgi:hypothetical protein